MSKQVKQLHVSLVGKEQIADYERVRDELGIQRDSDLVRHLLRWTARRMEWTERSHAEGGWRSQYYRLHRRIAELEERAGVSPSCDVDGTHAAHAPAGVSALLREARDAE